jgi:hypothetical protein
VTDVEKLQEALRLVTEVQAAIQPGETMCPECQHKRYANWHHKNAKDALEGAKSRIDKAITALRRED